MPGQRSAMRSVLGLLLALSLPVPAFAHRLEAEFRILPNRQIRIEAWFDGTRTPAKDAKVTVYQNDQLLLEAKLDDKGLMTFPFERNDPMRVLIDAGGGHRTQLRISTAALTGVGNPNEQGDEQSSVPPVDRSSRLSFKDVVIGTSFLLALAAFVLSWRNARVLSRRG